MWCLYWWKTAKSFPPTSTAPLPRAHRLCALKPPTSTNSSTCCSALNDPAHPVAPKTPAPTAAPLTLAVVPCTSLPATSPLPSTLDRTDITSYERSNLFDRGAVNPKHFGQEAEKISGKDRQVSPKAQANLRDFVETTTWTRGSETLYNEQASSSRGQTKFVVISGKHRQLQ